MRAAVGIAALLCLEAAAACATTTIDAERLMAEGRELVQSDPAGALDRFVEAAELFEQAGDDFGQARALNNQGQIFWAEAKPAEARDRFERALPLFRSAGEGLWVGRILGSLARLEEEAGRKPEARDLYREALSWVEAAGEPAVISETLVSLGALEVALGRPDEALPLLERALPLAQVAKSKLMEVSAVRILASIHFLRAEWELALASQRRALDLLTELEDVQGQAEALVLIAESAENLGQPLESLAAREAEIGLRTSLGDPEPLAQAHFRFGRFLESIGSFDQASQHYGKAIEHFEAAGDPRGHASAVYGVASARWALGEIDFARAQAQKALAAFRSVGDRAGEGDAQRLLGLLARREGKRAEAIGFLEQALQVYRDAGRAMQAAMTLSWLVQLYLQEGWEAGVLEKKIQWVSGLLDSGLSPAERPTFLFSLATIWLALARETEAQPLYEQTLALTRAHKQPWLEAETLGGLGISYELGGEPEKAFSFYLQALAVRDKLRTSARLHPLRQAMDSSSFDVYERAVLLALRLGRTADAFELTERARARSLTDVLARLALAPNGSGGDALRRESALRAEMDALEWRLTEAVDQEALRTRLTSLRQTHERVLAEIAAADPESAPLLGAGSPATVESLQETLDAKTTLVSYFLTRDTALAFVLTRGSLSVVPLPVDVRELTLAVERLRSSPKTSSSTFASQLSPRLIAPLADHLRTPKVGVIPHGPLHHVPFAALTVKERSLGEQYTLFHLPSASSLLYLRRTPSEGAAPLLALAYSPADKDSLPEAAPEAEEIVRALGGQLLTGTEATAETFLARASGYRILHLAAHGELDPQRPLFSRIRLAPGKEDDGSLHLHQIYNLVLPRTDLVVLSACESGIGPGSRGDEIAALGHGFFHAGVPTVVASLWRVGDISSRRLMVSFYRHLHNGLGKAEALQAAQAELRRSKDLADPFHWAGFVLMGKPD